jgi:nicotinamide-nucleotide amidase
VTSLAEILAIGDELVHGFAVDTNSAHIARELERLGVEVRRVTVVSDAPGALRAALGEACGRADVVVATGGLGPTEDDRTRAAAAAAGGVELRFDEDCWQGVLAWFARLGRTPPESNRRQAWLPAGARVLENRWGTAPGFCQRIGRAELFALPGVPREMVGMLELHVLPWVAERLGGGAFAFHELRTLGIHEAALGERLADLMAADHEPRVGITAHFGMMTVRIAARGSGTADAQARCAATAAEIRARIADVLAYEGAEPLESIVVRELGRAGATLAVAESCTGGLLAARLTGIAGASAVFREGVVTYHDAAKTQRLGVPPALLAAQGAVSEPVARAMVEGLLERAGAEFGIAITGIAGPDGGSDAKPVGLVWFALGARGRVRTWQRLFSALGREFVRERAVLEALVALRQALVDPGSVSG